MKKLAVVLAVASLGVLSHSAGAAVNWSLDMTTGSNTTPPPAYGNTRDFSSAAASVSVSAYSSTGGTGSTSPSNVTNRNTVDTIESAYLSVYSPVNGLGVVNRDGSNTASVAVTSATGSDNNEFVNNGSEHSMDNHGRSDVMLLTFTDQVALQSLKLGWLSGDSDVFILAWSGANPGGGIASQLVGKTFAQIAADTATDPSNGWRLIDSLSNVPLNNNTSFNNSVTPVYSSYWLIGTGGFNSASTGGGVTSGDKSGGNWTAFGSSGANYDYVKLAGIGGVTNGGGGTGGGGGSAPEPGSLALAGAAFLGMVGMRRRKAAV